MCSVYNKPTFKFMQSFKQIQRGENSVSHKKLTCLQKTRLHFILQNNVVFLTGTSMPPTGFEPAIPTSQKPQTLVLNRATTGIGHIVINAHTNCGHIFQCLVPIGTVKRDLTLILLMWRIG
jgi:hypothetical protein